MQSLPAHGMDAGAGDYQVNQSRFFAAMWILEICYGAWFRGGPLRRKAYGIVAHDRTLNGEIERMEAMK